MKKNETIKNNSNEKNNNNNNNNNGINTRNVKNITNSKNNVKNSSNKNRSTNRSTNSKNKINTKNKKQDDLKIINYVTSNQSKIDYANFVLNKIGYKVIGKKNTYPEIQANTNMEVASFTVIEAYKDLKIAFMKNDSGLVIPALNGFPSVYASYVENTLGYKGILKLLKGVKDRTCYYEDVFAYVDNFGKLKTFYQKTYGTISKKAKGKNGYPYDKIFIPKGSKKTAGQLTQQEYHSFYENTALLELVDYLNKQNNK